MDNNNIQLIDQRLVQFCSLIPQCKAQSAAAEKLLADTIITLEIKPIEAILALKKNLAISEPLFLYIKLAVLHMNMCSPLNY